MNQEVQTIEQAEAPGGRIADDWLIAYAAGNLSEAKSTLVATHASYHPELLNKIRDAESVAGALLGTTDKADLSDGFFDRLMESIDAQEGEAGEAIDLTKPASAKNSNVPQPLADYLNGDLADVKWRFMGPGMKQAKLWTGENGEKLWLLKAKGGTEIPEHGHNGSEMTLVLQGSYHVNGQKFGVGDLEIASDEIEDHRPMIDEGEDCICLVVTEAPIKLKSLMARAVQPFIGL